MQSMASTKVEFEDREDSESVLRALMDQQYGLSWVQFRYSLPKGGGGLSQEALDPVKSRGSQPHRDLKRLTIEETGTGDLKDMTSKLPPNEVAFVIYNNQKGSRVEDTAENTRKFLEGKRWKDWTELRRVREEHFQRFVLREIARVVQETHAAAESLRVKQLASKAGFYIPEGTAMHDPVALIKDLIDASPVLDQQLMDSLSRIYDEGNEQEQEHSVFFAVRDVVLFLEKLAAEAEERERQAALQAKIEARAKRKGAKGGRGSVAANVEKKVVRSKRPSAESTSFHRGSIIPPTEEQKLAMSMDDPSSPLGGSVGSPLMSVSSPLPMTEENESVGGDSTPKARMDELSDMKFGDEGFQDSAPTLNLSNPSDSPGRSEPDDAFAYLDEEEDSDLIFQRMIEEEARKKAQQMEISSVQIQAVGRGYIARKAWYSVLRQQPAYHTPKQKEARHLNLFLVVVWCPSVVSADMQESAVFHLREVVMLLNMAATSEVDQIENALDSTLEIQGPNTVTTQPALVSEELSVDLAESRSSVAEADKEPLIEVPHVVHKARSQAALTSQRLMQAIVDEYMEQDSLGKLEHEKKEDMGSNFVVTFAEQDLYKQLVQKYAQILTVHDKHGTEKLVGGKMVVIPDKKIEYESSLEARLAYQGHMEAAKRIVTRAPQSNAQEILGDEASFVWTKTRLEDLPKPFQFAPWWTLSFPLRLRDLQQSLGATDNDNQAWAKMPRTPSLKSFKNLPELYSGVSARTFLDVYNIKCADIGVTKRAANERNFLRMVSKYCNSKEFKLRESGLGHKSIDCLMQALSTKACTITSLDLSSNPLGDAGAEVIATFLGQNKTLNNLDLQSCSLAAAGMGHIFGALQQGNKTLASLNLASIGTTGRNVLGDGGAKACSKCLQFNRSVTTLSLANNRLAAPQLTFLCEGLARNATLKVLNLADNFIKDDGATSLANGIRNGVLQELTLSRNGIHCEGAIALAKAIEMSKPPVDKLLLDGNGVGPSGVQALAEILSNKNTILQTLSLEGNKMDAEAARQLCDELLFKMTIVKDKFGHPVDTLVQYPRSLTCLKLAHNDFFDEGVQYVAKVVSGNSTLTSLDLSYTRTSDKGATAMGQALQQNSALVDISLSWNNITDVGFVDMAASLGGHEHLQQLNIQGNKMGEGAGIALIALLATSTSITSLDYDFNDLTYEQDQAVKGLLEKNSGSFQQNHKESLHKQVDVLSEIADRQQGLVNQLAAEKKKLHAVNAAVEKTRKTIAAEKEQMAEELWKIKMAIDRSKRQIENMENEHKRVCTEQEGNEKEWERQLDDADTELEKSKHVRDRLRKRLTTMVKEIMTQKDQDKQWCTKLLIDLDIHKGLESSALMNKSRAMTQIRTVLQTSAEIEDEMDEDVVDQARELLDQDQTNQLETLLQARRVHLREMLTAVQSPVKQGRFKTTAKKIGLLTSATLPSTSKAAKQQKDKQHDKDERVSITKFKVKQAVQQTMESSKGKKQASTKGAKEEEAEMAIATEPAVPSSDKSTARTESASKGPAPALKRNAPTQSGPKTITKPKGSRRRSSASFDPVGAQEEETKNVSRESRSSMDKRRSSLDRRSSIDQRRSSVDGRSSMDRRRSSVDILKGSKSPIARSGAGSNLRRQATMVERGKSKSGRESPLRRQTSMIDKPSRTEKRKSTAPVPQEESNPLPVPSHQPQEPEKPLVPSAGALGEGGTQLLMRKDKESRFEVDVTIMRTLADEHRRNVERANEDKNKYLQMLKKQIADRQKRASAAPGQMGVGFMAGKKIAQENAAAEAEAEKLAQRKGSKGGRRASMSFNRVESSGFDRIGSTTSVLSTDSLEFGDIVQNLRGGSADSQGPLQI